MLPTREAPARGSSEPEVDHIVLRALRAACVAAGSMVTARDVSQWIPTPELALLRHPCGLDDPAAADVIETVLERALSTGEVFVRESPSGAAPRWGRRGVVLEPQVLHVRESMTFERVEALVHAAVVRLGRPVQPADLIAQAGLAPDAATASRKIIDRRLGSLVRSGRLVIVERLFPRHEGGSNLYLPSTCDPSVYTGRPEPAERDEVLAAVLAIWAANSTGVDGEDTRPGHPVLLAEVLRRLPDQDPDRVSQMLRSLSRQARSVLRVVRCVNREIIGWVPREVTDAAGADTLRAADGSTIGSNCRLAVLALSRACERLGVPLASSLQVKAEARADPALFPPGAGGMSRALESVSRDLTLKNGARSRRWKTRAVRVGCVEGRAYYALPKRLPAARLHLQLLLVEERLRRERIIEQVQDLEHCVIGMVAAVRSIGLTLHLAESHRILQEVLASTDLEERTREMVGERVASLQDALRHLERWVRRAPASAEQSHAMEVPTWSSEGFYEMAVRVRSGPALERIRSCMVTSYGKTVRCIPNPEFVSRQAKDPRHSAEWLFDRTSALLRLALEHGGSECIQQSIVARRELGILRDPELVRTALISGTLDERLAAAACLAFLWSDGGNAALREAAVSDPVAGVRQVALWGFGFAQGEDAVGLARRRSTADPDSGVRMFAREIVETVLEDRRGWWAL